MSSIERRDFIKGAAGAAVGLAGMPAILRGTDDRKVRLGIIGTGGRGRSLLGLLLRRTDTAVNALCDIDPEALQQAVSMV
ncbi:MAG: twin-arginine translocation signal domain-containing protein, partial [Gemmatimonadota bacterium]|nr:twin-arginine translocation signal domain-containing protein [Gemmatimonadota bacterium]